jgi:hypothetical protein
MTGDIDRRAGATQIARSDPLRYGPNLAPIDGVFKTMASAEGAAGWKPFTDFDDLLD